MPERSAQRGFQLIRLLVLAALLMAVPALLTTFVVVDDSVGRGRAIAALVGIFALPLLICVAIENVALKVRKREVRAELIAVWLYPLAFFSVLVLAFTLFATETARAYGRMGDRYGWASGWIGDLANSLARTMDPTIPERVPRPGAGAPSATAESIPSVSAPKDKPKPTPKSSETTTIHTLVPPNPESPPSSHGRFSAFPMQYDDAHPKGVAFTEPTSCDQLADVSDMAAGYNSQAWRGTVETLAARRYPTGVEFLKVQDDKTLGAWLQSRDSFDELALGFSTAVHEGCHLWGFKQFSGSQYVYRVTDSLVIKTKRLKNFNRSEILTRHIDKTQDKYAGTYLEGSSGAQGFNLLLDEYNAYVHSLAADYCVRDLRSPNMAVSAKDGILTFMYYVETYLQIARDKHPKDHAAILADRGTRRAILTIWARAEYWLRKTQDVQNLGLRADEIETWVYEADRLKEIAAVRDAEIAGGSTP